MHITNYTQLGELVSELASKLADGKKISVTVHDLDRLRGSGDWWSGRNMQPADVSTDVSIVTPPQPASEMLAKLFGDIAEKD